MRTKLYTIAPYTMKYEKNPDTKCTCSNSKHHAKWILNEAGIIRSIENVLKNSNMSKLTKDAYKLVMNMSGFIAHYSHAGFMDYYSNVEDFRRDLQASNDTQDYARYTTDTAFSEGEQKEYYAQQARVLKAIGELCKKYKVHTQTEENVSVQNKIALLDECISRAKTDDVYAKKILQKLELI